MEPPTPAGIHRPAPGRPGRQVLSPGGWQAPPGHAAGWDWVPPAGAGVRLDRMPRWVRILYWTPFVDRYAQRWMWPRGGFDVDPSPDVDPAEGGLVWSTPPPPSRSRRARAPSRVVTAVIGLFDPAERYMRRRAFGPDRFGPRGWSRMRQVRRRRAARPGGCGPGGCAARQPSAAEPESLREFSERMWARHEAAVRAAQRRWAEPARICADELIRTGSTVLSTDYGQVRGRMVRFWRGDSVLALECVGPDLDDRGGSQTRLSRQHAADTDVIAGYLVRQVAQLDERPEPD